MRVLLSLWHAALRSFYQRFYRLEAQEFSAELLPLVQGFDCGDEPWSRPVSAWIQNGDALADMANPKYGTRVWLYWLRNRLVGYGSIGLTRRTIPPPAGPYVNVSIIPFFGVQRSYHRKPRWAARDERFAGQIMNDLIRAARDIGRPLLILYVHSRNTRAKRFYEKFGFEATGFIRDGHELMTLRF